MLKRSSLKIVKELICDGALDRVAGILLLEVGCICLGGCTLKWSMSPLSKT